MEWDLDPVVAEQLRDEAKKSSRVRIVLDNNNFSSLQPTAASRPQPGEYMLVELQGELVYPTEGEDELSGLASLGASSANTNDLKNIIFEDELSNKRFIVGKIEEDDVKAAKTKATLKMGTLFVEGERMKIAGPTLVLVNRNQIELSAVPKNNTNSSSNEDSKDTKDKNSTKKNGDTDDSAETTTVDEMSKQNGLPSDFYPDGAISQSSFTLKHQSSKTTRRRRQEEDDDDYNEEEEEIYLKSMEEDELMNDILADEQNNNNNYCNSDKNKKSFAPSYEHWKLAGTTSLGNSEITSEILLQSLNASCAKQDSLDNCQNNNNNKIKIDKNNDRASYSVSGVLAQKYLFKSKPARQTKAA